MMIMVSEPHYTLTIDYYLVVHEDSAMTVWNGYKLVGDNIDKTVCPSFERTLSVYTIIIHMLYWTELVHLT